MGINSVVRVISLPAAEARRATFEADARDAGVDWGFFDALRGPELPLRHDADACLIHTGRPLRPGELGCYASHYSLWLWFLGTDKDQLLVLEDDVIVDWPALKVLCNNDMARHGIHIVKLYATHPPKSQIARYQLMSDHSHLMRLYGFCYGTQGYLLTRQAAHALVKSCQTLTMPIDWAMSRYWDYGIVNYLYMPHPIIERLGVSTIGHNVVSSFQSNRQQKNQRLVWRIIERIRRAVFDFQNRKSIFGQPVDGQANLF